MGCYGIGIERILTAAIETSAAANGGSQLRPQPMPSRPSRSSSPSPTSATLALLAAGEEVAASISNAAGVDVLLDDRDERAGVKFKDADLVGIPYRINIGRGVAEGKVEFLDRLQNITEDVALSDVVAKVSERITTTLRNPLSAAGL